MHHVRGGDVIVLGGEEGYEGKGRQAGYELLSEIQNPESNRRQGTKQYGILTRAAL